MFNMWLRGLGHAFWEICGRMLGATVEVFWIVLRMHLEKIKLLRLIQQTHANDCSTMFFNKGRVVEPQMGAMETIPSSLPELPKPYRIGGNDTFKLPGAP